MSFHSLAYRIGLRENAVTWKHTIWFAKIWHKIIQCEMCQLNHKNGLADTNTLKTSYEFIFYFFIFFNDYSECTTQGRLPTQSLLGGCNWGFNVDYCNSSSMFPGWAAKPVQRRAEFVIQHPLNGSANKRQDRCTVRHPTQASAIGQRWSARSEVV